LVAILDFGKKKGVHTFHVTGSKDELHKIVEATRENGAIFADTPIINHVHRGQYILYLKLKLELVGVNGGYEQRNRNAFTVNNDGKTDIEK
jgi:hypothetical protein